jgi:sec-independent protein translocase protein TatC
MKVPRWLARFRAPLAGAEMSFLDHLDELRSVILSCIGALLILAIGAWFVSGYVLDFLVTHTVGTAQFIKPLEAFTTRIKLAFLMAFIAGLPFIAFQIWSFVVPGLLGREKRIVLPLVLWSTLLFVIGVAFSALALSPTMLRIMLSFGTEVVEADIAIGFLFDFFVKMAFACGFLFQLPLVVAVLSHFGIVTPEFLTSKWRHAIVIILIIAAVVTPGDGPSQLVLALPVILLYFVSIWISKGIWRGKRRREEEEESGETDGDGGDGSNGADDEEGNDGDDASNGADDEEGNDGDDASSGADDGEEDDGDDASSGTDDGKTQAGEEGVDRDNKSDKEEVEQRGSQEPEGGSGDKIDSGPRPLHPPDGDWSI